jgi:hypothetical protein
MMMTDGPFVSTWLTEFPDDCGKPHNWERFVQAGSCQCTACEEHREPWLECGECMTRWEYTNHFTWHQAWDKAPWG